MLTTEAFNALLKTLEEPPSHAVFILCTTEIQKVPETIASRCFRVNFTKATSEELFRSLSRIVKKEEIKTDKEALLEIAELSDGSFRDGAKILEEVSLFAGRKAITADLVNEKYNTLGIGKSVSEMLNFLAKKDVKKGISLCRDLTKQGMDFKFFIEQLINRLHLMLLIQVGAEKGNMEVELGTGEIQKLFELLSVAYNDTKYAVLQQMPLEIVVLEWGRSEEKNDSVVDLPLESSNSSLKTSDEVRAVGATTPKTNGQAVLRANSSDKFFENFINEVKLENHLIAGVLRSCSAEEIIDGKLNILANSKFHKEKLEEAKTMILLESAAKKILDKDIKINVHIRGGDRHE